MENMEIMNIEEVNNAEVTEVTCDEVEETKDNSSLAIGILIGAVGTLAVKGIVSLIGKGVKKAKAKKAEAQKQSKDEATDNVIVVENDDTESED